MNTIIYDIKTNTASSKEWLAVTKDMVITAFDSFLPSTAEPVKSNITIRDFFGSHIADAVNTIKKIKE
jgi:hypothetical protein